ncbi:MAG TPA: insulinase family protein [Deltaproteobacteria bacterium]|nr:insulinase family protein [Deltaproteobacteria bacterium]
MFGPVLNRCTRCFGFQRTGPSRVTTEGQGSVTVMSMSRSTRQAAFARFVNRFAAPCAALVFAACMPKAPSDPAGTVLPGPFPSEIVREGTESQLAIDFEEYDLENGLHVILSPDASVPFVWVNVWYRVGSKDEQEGLTGFAHLFEHMMFQGSEHADGDFFGPLQAVGARINGTTNFDRTNYFEGVPSEHLPLALFLESDRMGWLLPAMTPERLANQQKVVRNERRQRYDNRPYGKVRLWLNESLYAEGHPYRVPTIGKHEDIENARMEDVQDFFKKWYVPNNASLAIVGDFEPAEAKALVEKYFGHIPKGPQPIPVTHAPATLLDPVSVHYASKVPHHKVWLAWHSPKLYAPGDADLDIVSGLLSEGRDSLLYQRLVKEKGLAKDVAAYQSSSFLTSSYIITATAAKGHTTDEIVAEIDAVLQEFLSAPPSVEAVEDTKAQWEVRAYGGLQTISSKADKLNSYHVLTGNTGYLATDVSRYLAVTPDSVHQAAKMYLDVAGRVTLHVHPLGEAPEGAIVDAPAGPKGGE